MPRSDDEQHAQLIELARRIHELKRAWEAVHPYETFKVDPKLSRILSLLPEYDSGRVRKAAPVRGVARAPSFFTVAKLAERLDAPLCALAPSKNHGVFSDAQLELITRAIRGLLSIFSRPAAPRAKDFDEMVPFETVQKEAYDFAAGLHGIEGDFAPELHDVFRGIHGIESERLQVIRITSDSMSPLLLTGDRVLIDTSRRRPREGDVVGVVSEDHGRIVGYWHALQRRCFLKKENDEYPTIALGPAEEWQVIGTITSFVDAPLHPRDRLQRR